MAVSYTAESRSTSAGSHASGQHRQPSSEYLSSLNKKLPEYEYPVPVIVRNTFIDTQVGRPVSLEEFFEERRIRSCPGAAPPEQNAPISDAVFPEYDVPTHAMNTPEPPPLQRAITTGAQAFMARFAEATGFWTTPEYDSSLYNAEAFDATGAQQMPRVLMLSEALPDPGLAQLGSYEMPTVGSAGHQVGNCKPCAFLYTKGCDNGAQCPFCHLCAPDEKRRRQKEKQAAFREMRRQRRQIRL